MSAVILSIPPTHWVCPNCPAEEVTSGATPNRYHECRGLAGITAPMIPAGSGARVRAVEREDYIGREVVQYDGNRRPIMAIYTDRPDGSNDCVVLAPTAHAEARID